MELLPAPGLAMNILLAADGSEYTKRAARYLAEHFSDLTRKPRIHVLHVQPPLPHPGAAAAVGKKSIARYQLENSEKALAVAGKELTKGGLDFTSSYIVGEVAAGVKDVCKKNAIDLIVMGSHGHGAVASVVMGSSATRILATVKLPALIVR